MESDALDPQSDAQVAMIQIGSSPSAVPSFNALMGKEKEPVPDGMSTVLMAPFSSFAS